MREFLYKLVQRLQEEARPLSRNKHFHAFTGEARRALRIDRHLRDLQEHLSKLRKLGERPRVRALPGGGVQMVMSHPALSVVRTATLCAEEVLLLARHPAGAWGLGGAESASRSGEPAARQG